MSCLPPKLENWKEQLQQQPTQETARAIIAEYFSFFGKEKVKEELWLLTTGTLTNDEMHQAQSAKDRHDLLFFYEFTGMMVEAVWWVSKQNG